jgi:hypothetical protein
MDDVLPAFFYVTGDRLAVRVWEEECSAAEKNA